MKQKLLFLGLLSTLLIFQWIQFSGAYRDPTPLISGSGFNIEFNTGQALAFAGDATLQIEILSGFLNGSSGSLTVYNNGGTLSFSASDNSTIEISSPDAEEGFDISISGANSTTATGRFIHEATILTGNSLTIMWSWRIESWVGKYTLFALGIAGLTLMIASPTWCAMTIKKKGFDPDSFEMIMYALLIMCVGFGLVVMWLW